jgi:hypothetical protein
MLRDEDSFFSKNSMKTEKEQRHDKAISKGGTLRLKGSPNNPPENDLKAGVTAEDVVNAISSSGYPLQSVVASKLRKHFAVQEEWSFVDTDEHITRSIDLFAEIFLFNPETQLQSRVRPALNLIVECKQSELPYVFFLSDEKVRTPRFPLISGLAHERITVTKEDTKNGWPGWNVDLLKTLGLDQHSFLRSDVAFCTTFSRCEQKGSKVRLSGNEPYNSLVQPLVKALEHFHTIEQPISTQVYYDLHIAIGLAVLESPMVGVHASSSIEPFMVPWVRIPRHRGLEGTQSYEHRRNIYAIDVVHIAFLDTYIETHLLPFAGQLASRALKHHVEIADGKGFLPGKGKKLDDDSEALIIPTEASRRRDSFLRLTSKGSDSLTTIPGLDSESLAEIESLLQAAGIGYACLPEDYEVAPLKLLVTSSDLPAVKKLLADFRIRTPKGDLLPIPW